MSENEKKRLDLSALNFKEEPVPSSVALADEKSYVPDTNVGDMISRQAAIDAVMNKPAWHNSDGSYYHSSDIRKALEALPSAQPETKCASCRYRNLEWDEEPCDSCTIGGKDCHYKPERKNPAQPESAKEYCNDCIHCEMCSWYPYEGCEFKDDGHLLYNHGYNDAKREIALSGEYERAYQRGKEDALKEASHE